jgi:hypothetical protein
VLLLSEVVSSLAATYTRGNITNPEWYRTAGYLKAGKASGAVGFILTFKGLISDKKKQEKNFSNPKEEQKWQTKRQLKKE